MRERQRRHKYQQRLSKQEDSKDEHSVFPHVRTMMNQIKQDRASITDIANQFTIKRTVISDIADKMEMQANAVTTDRAAIAVIKKHISEEQELITTEASRIRTEVTNCRSLKTESETGLRDQAQAITIETGKVDAQMKTTQKTVNDSAAIVELMRKENEKGNKIIRSIQSLDTTESDIKSIKTLIKAYGNTIQHQLNAKITTSLTPTTILVTLSSNIKEIQLKFDKMTAFTKTTKEIVKKEGTDTIARITAQVETIFNAQQSALQRRVDKIETTIATKLNQHKDITKSAVDEIRKVKIDYLNLFEKKKQSMNRHIEKTFDDFKIKTAKFDTYATLICYRND